MNVVILAPLLIHVMRFSIINHDLQQDLWKFHTYVNIVINGLTRVGHSPHDPQLTLDTAGPRCPPSPSGGQGGQCSGDPASKGVDPSTPAAACPPGGQGSACWSQPETMIPLKYDLIAPFWF